MATGPGTGAMTLGVRSRVRTSRDRGPGAGRHVFGRTGPGQGDLAEAEYLLPLRWTDDAQLPELTAYLHRLVRWISVTVVDGSPDELFDAHRAAWPRQVRQLRPEGWPGANGKVAGVMTGVRRAEHDLLVIADDDVRYDLRELTELVGLLADHDLVRPQNYYSSLPWFARWDTARTLLNRAFDADFPGTLGIRRATLVQAGGYSGNVLFENLELIRTIRAAGGREHVALGLFVARVPPTGPHFLGQRVRQAYDDFAQPGRLALELSLLPIIMWSSRRPTRALRLLATVCALAELGRRRAGGTAVFPASSAAWAPLWVLERAVCVWLALGYRRRGVPYAGGRLRSAATPHRLLRRKLDPHRQRRLRSELEAVA